MKLHTILVDEYDLKWLQPYQIGQIYSVSRRTVSRLLDEMRANPKYRNAFHTISQRMKLVRVRDFEMFLQERDKARVEN